MAGVQETVVKARQAWDTRFGTDLALSTLTIVLMSCPSLAGTPAVPRISRFGHPLKPSAAEKTAHEVIRHLTPW